MSLCNQLIAECLYCLSGQYSSTSPAWGGGECGGQVHQGDKHRAQDLLPGSSWPRNQTSEVLLHAGKSKTYLKRLREINEDLTVLNELLSLESGPFPC